jgi:protein O-mannosyl-transferase
MNGEKAPENRGLVEFLPSSWRHGWLFGLFLVAVTLIAYGPAWRAGFIWDDDVYVTQNPLLTAPDGLRQIWFSLQSPSQYFPLTYTTFYVERALWGFHPLGYHLVNLLLHAANALLVWRVLARLRLPGAWLAAAIFALHPVQVESVAWITERKNVLMAFFFLLTLLAWIRFIDEKTARPWRFYVLALVFYALALFGKTTACTLPAALLLILWLGKMPINWRRLAQVAPFVAMGIGMGLVTMWWERYHQGTQGKLFEMGAVERVLVANRALWFYAGKLLWPANLAFSYPHWTISASDLGAYVWVLATAVLGLVIWRTRRWAGRSVEVAAVYFAATLSPMLGFIMLYTFRYTFVADHYQYLACIGPMALAAAGMEAGLGRLAWRKPFLQPALCAALLLTLGALTWKQCGMYANNKTLWQTTVRLSPNSWMAQYNLGNAFRLEDRMDEAFLHYQKAFEINPDNAEFHNNLGIVLLQNGRVKEAITQYREALQIDPNFAEAHYNLGNIFLKKGRVDEAITQFRQALQIKPDFAEAHYNLGNALLQMGKVDEGIFHYRKALEINPAYAEARNNLGSALLQKGGVDEAISQYQEALHINPGYADAHRNLGLALARKGRLDEAITHFQQALKIRPDFAGAHVNLGNVLLQKGRLDEAISQYQEALQIDPDNGDAQNNTGNVLLQKGNMNEAIAHFQKALQLQPANSGFQNNLAWLLATCPQAALRNGHKAVELAERANQLAGGENPTILHTLAAAYAETGRFSEAMETAQRALRLAGAQSNTNLAGQLQSELKLYQAGSPFHSPAQPH